MFLEPVSTWERRFTVLPICVAGGGGGRAAYWLKGIFYQRDPIIYCPVKASKSPTGER